jgi:hypothetical protein
MGCLRSELPTILALDPTWYASPLDHRRQYNLHVDGTHLPGLVQLQDKAGAILGGCIVAGPPLPNIAVVTQPGLIFL